MKMFEMKMHSALYFLGSNGFSEDPNKNELPENPKDSVDKTAEQEIVESEMVTQDTVEAVDDAVNQAKAGEESVKEDISSKLKKDAEAAKLDGTVGGIVPSSFNVLGNEIYKNHSSDYNVKEQTTIYSKRCAENEIYKKWDKNIQDGFSRLMDALLEHKYFDNLFGKNTAKSVKQICDMYKDYLVKQYEKNVWESDDDTFNKVKKNLFVEGSETDPAEAIYKELTGTSLKATETEHRHAYSVIAEEKSIDTKDNNPETAPDSPDIKAQQQFLGADLPNYLWNLKGSGNATAISKYLPFISIDKPSDQDKRAIKDFVKLANNYGEQKLFDLFTNAKDNRTEQEWLSATQNFDPKVKDKSDLEAIMNAGKMYIKTQAVDVSLGNQHNVYLSVLQIIKDYGGCEKAMNAFKGEIDEFNKNKLSGRERRYFDNGETLKEKNPDFYKVVSQINKVFDKKDYGNATRLFDKELSAEISNEELINILADLNNDGTLNQRDAGFAKTGNQFMEIVKQIGTDTALTDTALNNLRKRAKLLNATKELGLSEEQLNGNSKEIIYFLQNIISDPKEDLYTLMTEGPVFTEKQNEAIKYLQEQGIDDPQNPEFQKKVNEFLKNVDTSKLSNIEGATVASSEGLHQAVAAALYTEYTRGVGLGGRISFDEWIKGVSLNGGVQYGDGGFNGGLTLSYNKEFDLGKGWSMTTEASFGFVPFVHVAGSAGAEIAKKWVTQNGVEDKIGLRFDYTNIGGAVNVYSALVGWSQDKLAGLNERENELKGEFKDISKSLLDQISGELGDKALDLDDENIRKQVSEILGDMDEVKEFKPEEQKKFISNTIDYLMAYDDEQLNNDVVRSVIAAKMAERYAAARKESTKNSIDGKAYLSGVRAGVAFVQAGVWGAPVFHAGVSFSSHKYDGYGDVNYNTYKSEAPTEVKENSEWNQDMLDKFNNTLHLSEGLRLTEDGFVVIPTQCLDNVNVYVNENMKGKLAKDEKGNILMPATSVMSWPSIKAGTSSYSAEFIIGGGEKSGSIKLDKNGLPTEWAKDKAELAAESNNELLNNALKQLKAKFLEDLDLQAFEFSDEELSNLNLESGKVYTLIFEKNTGGNINVMAKENDNGKWQIEYKTEKKEGIMNGDAEEIAKTVYGEAQKCKTNALYAISHSNINGLTSLYRDFANEIKKKNYDNAKTIIVDMLPKMDSFINKYEGKGAVNFSSIIGNLKTLEGADLGQALLSINNVFARVASVKGGSDGEYSFRKYENGKEVQKSIGSIIQERAEQISSKLQKSQLNNNVKDAYSALINKSEDYRKSDEHKSEFTATSKGTQTLENAVGINLGNAINAENLLFNPEIYADMQSDLDKFSLDENSKQVLHEHALEEFVNNKALISPVLKSLGFTKNPKVEVGAYDNEKGQLTLDIDGKNVILNADLKFGYFAQCVNHMLILNNISATIPETGGSVNFQNNVVEGGTISESSKSTIMSTTKIDVDVAGVFGKKGPSSKPRTKENPLSPESDPNKNKDPNSTQTPPPTDDTSTNTSTTTGRED